jgi:hypothetical protein
MRSLLREEGPQTFLIFLIPQQRLLLREQSLHQRRES